MALKPGTMLGPYEVLSLIGTGGMGEVYRGHDPRLNRIVALKVLHKHLAERADLLERFKREATTIANLKHAHICVLYDIGEDKGTHFLVLEFLEGETLAHRLMKGPMPLEKVLEYACEISDALDKAHRSGVTHRDIKPGNIMLTKEGSKVLDFGLAKLKQEAVAPNLPQSLIPTAPSGLTQDGQILGTLQYMAPEQIEGKIDDIDSRTDIFAFGAVVYEMITGKKAFEGSSTASVMGAILKDNPPPMSSLQPMTPPSLDRVVKRCLLKAQEERWQTAWDLWHELAWIKEGGSQAGIPAQVAARRKRRERVLAAVAAIAILVAVALAVRDFRVSPAPAEPVRFLVSTPSMPEPSQLSISPDGRLVVFVATTVAGTQSLWIRPLDSVTAQPLPGTEMTDIAPDPFWSPDSRSIGFFVGSKLKKIEVSGGPPQTLSDGTDGGTWNQEGAIVFVYNNLLHRVSAAGGQATPFLPLDKSRQERAQRWPHFLPDSRHFLYLSLSEQPEQSGIYLGSLDSQQTTLLLPTTSMAVYAPPGYVLFLRENTLMAQPFDASRLQLSGEAFPIAERLLYNSGAQRGGFAVSANGLLVYRSNPAEAQEDKQLAWFDRAGKQLGVIGPKGDYRNPRLSPDGRRVAVERITGGNKDIWLLEVERGTASRFTFDPGEERLPVWSPDGSRIVFDSDRGGFSLYQKAASGAGNEELLLKGGERPADWSSDGRFLAFFGMSGVFNDLSILPLSGDPRQAGSSPGLAVGTEGRKPISFLKTQFIEAQPQFSPDGKWMAYVSDESGRNEVYVQSFPTASGKWQVSTEGGVHPRWRPDGKELFYLALDRKLMAAPVRAGATFEAATPVELFEARTAYGPVRGLGLAHQYDITPDGQRFLLNLETQASSPTPITVVLNWTAALKK